MSKQKGRSHESLVSKNPTNNECISDKSEVEAPSIQTRKEFTDAFFFAMFETIIKSREVRPSIDITMMGREMMEHETETIAAGAVSFKFLMEESMIIPIPTNEETIDSIRLSKDSRKSFDNSIIRNSESDKEDSTLVSGEKLEFTNGNKYTGKIKNGLMHGKGLFTWNDGSQYKGQFCEGFPCGMGKMCLPDMSVYLGNFWRGEFHGFGTLNVTGTKMIYSGNWSDGRGWLLHEPDNFYEGMWSNNFRHGYGFRSYKDGGKYKGNWKEGLRSGKGTMLYSNNDYYKGEWSDGVPHGYGEYTWNTYLNTRLVVPVLNYYKGSWEKGMRHGAGEMNFGSETGARMAGIWVNNLKHGPGVMISKLGQRVERLALFLNDKPASQNQKSSSANPVLGRRSNEKTNKDGAGPDLIKEINQNRTSKLSDVSESQRAYMRSVEKDMLRNSVCQNMNHLRELYRKYATIATDEDFEEMDVLLIRLFLWQLLRDVEIYRGGKSLIEIDKFLAQNPDLLIEDPHDPFEPIYFWQFIQIVFALACHFYKVGLLQSVVPRGPICASIFKAFLHNEVLVKIANPTGIALREYRDLVPIYRVYALYLCVGEAHTAKQFLNKVCVKKATEPSCYCPLFDETSADSYEKPPVNGLNAFPFDHTLDYLIIDLKLGERPQIKDPLMKEDDFRNTLNALRFLRPRRVVQCLTTVCPLIKKKDLIVNMEYKLCFLEFYEVFLLCAKTLVEGKLVQKFGKLETGVDKPKSEPVIAVPSRNDAVKKKKKGTK
ncbi:radial spoke head 10 homolog B isoform X2 [Aethina tumida]|uniref:radial spoke head 10 homolog B isoform X2 n=1 Tax=Aethina tumida TaxID=116153 RepID=UPI0021493171|nr:radial spoke head 10 homolog B isoform X2 [Aethina tumida]